MTEITYGEQMPRVWTVPSRHVTPEEGCLKCEKGQQEYPGHGCGEFQAMDTIEWCRSVGFTLDPWQEWFLAQSLGCSPDGRWAAMENALIVSRQNGKGAILEARELAGIYLLGEGKIIHTAHEFKTSIEHFRRCRQVIENDPGLSRRVQRIAASHGDEAIVLKKEPTMIMGADGKYVFKKAERELRFLARSRGSGRGFSADCLVYDEAMILSEDQVGASMPTMSARANPQIFYTASSGLEDSFQLGAVRQRMLKPRGDDALFGAEWSINGHTDECPRDEIRGRDTNYYIICDRHDDRDDPKSWAKANPAMGYRINERFTRMELMGMPPDQFDVERLGLGKWPTDDEAWSVVSEPLWERLSTTQEDTGFPTKPMSFGIDIDEDGKSATICVAWEHSSGRPVLEIPRNGMQNGTDWIIPWLKDRYSKYQPCAIAVPKASPAGSLIEDGKKLWREKFLAVGPGDESAAFAFFVQQAKEEQFWHFGKEGAPALWHSIGKADTRDVGDGGKSWSRRDSESDITPATAATLALYALNKMKRSYDPMRSIG